MRDSMDKRERVKLGGLWDAAKATSDALKKHSPDVTSVKNAYQATYNLGSKAINTVKDNGVPSVIKEYIPGPETQEKIGSVLKHPLTCEVSKILLPGASATAACNIIGAVINSGAYPIQDTKKSEELKQQLEVLQADYLKLCAELEHVKESRSLPDIKLIPVRSTL